MTTAAGLQQSGLRLHSRDKDYCDVCGEFQVSKQTECVPYVTHSSASEIIVESPVVISSASTQVMPNPFEVGPAIC